MRRGREPGMSRTLDLARALVARPSVTPSDCGCQELIAAELEPLGFTIERLRFGDVDNLWARRGSGPPLLCLAGHTDVVPSGPESSWSSPPFGAEVHEGVLFGRGTADMKGAVAAMVTACRDFLGAAGTTRGALAFLLTSDEEGPARDGTRRVIDTLEARGEKIDWCLIGEPSSTGRLGDTVRIGRRGSLDGHLLVRGRQGHVAYPDLAHNPIHTALPVLARLAASRWDEGDGDFPPTTFQLSNLASGTGATNVIPGSLEARFNFRYSPAVTVAELQDAVERMVAGLEPDHELTWHLSGEPFITRGGALIEAAQQAIRDTVGLEPTLSTGGGTSDGRFIAPTGAQVAELGLVSASIHQVDERVPLTDLEQLAAMYRRILELLLAP